MLVLTRRVGETLKIGDDIEIVVLSDERGQVRLGIDAPKNINIVRSELLLRPREIKSTHITAQSESPQERRIIRRKLY